MANNEPSTREVLRLLIQIRHALGLRTRILTTKTQDHAYLAENAIDRVRRLAGALVQMVQQEVGIKIATAHAPWSWAGRHASWTLNRFSVNKGRTSFEVARGKPYKGLVAKFGEPVHAYCRSNFKGEPRWARWKVKTP